jgi:hypothetical protein
MISFVVVDLPYRIYFLPNFVFAFGISAICIWHLPVVHAHQHINYTNGKYAGKVRP